MEIKIECPWCNQEYSVDESLIGQKVRCSSCDNTFNVWGPDNPPIAPEHSDTNNAKPSKPFGEFIDESAFSVSQTKTQSEKRNHMKEYKVLTQKDKWFSGKFDPELLEKAINAYASQGWRVVAAATASFPGIISANREEMVIILERDK